MKRLFNGEIKTRKCVDCGSIFADAFGNEQCTDCFAEAESKETDKLMQDYELEDENEIPEKPEPTKPNEEDLKRD